MRNSALKSESGRSQPLVLPIIITWQAAEPCGTCTLVARRPTRSPWTRTTGAAAGNRRSAGLWDWQLAQLPAESTAGPNRRRRRGVVKTLKRRNNKKSSTFLKNMRVFAGGSDSHNQCSNSIRLEARPGSRTRAPRAYPVETTRRVLLDPTLHAFALCFQLERGLSKG